MQAGRVHPVRDSHILCIMSAQEHVDLRGEGEPIAANTKQRFLGLQKKPPFPREYRPRRPLRAIKIPNTKPARRLERFDSFHSMHYENPGFTAQDVFDDDEIQAMVPTKWMDILERRAEAILPPRREALVAEFAGRSKRKGEEDSQNGGFCMMYSKQKFDNKGVSKNRKTVRNSFAIKHSYACQLRNIETGTQWLIIKTEEAPDSND